MMSPEWEYAGCDDLAATRRLSAKPYLVDPKARWRPPAGPL